MRPVAANAPVNDSVEPTTIGGFSAPPVSFCLVEQAVIPATGTAAARTENIRLRTGGSSLVHGAGVVDDDTAKHGQHRIDLFEVCVPDRTFIEIVSVENRNVAKAPGLDHAQPVLVRPAQ